MSKLSLDLFKHIVSNKNYNFHEISFHGSEDTLNLTIYDKNNKNEFTRISIRDIPIDLLLDGELPEELYKLKLENKYYVLQCLKIKNLLNNLPPKLKKLYLFSTDSKLDNLPSSLEILELHGNYDNCYDFDYLPAGLKTLLINVKTKSKLDNLPSGLENLLLLKEFTQGLKNLPFGLKFLEINTFSNLNIILPKNILCVIFPEDNNYLRRKLLKSYPKVSYNDEKYKSNIELYDEKIIFQD